MNEITGKFRRHRLMVTSFRMISRSRPVLMTLHLDWSHPHVFCREKSWAGDECSCAMCACTDVETPRIEASQVRSLSPVRSWKQRADAVIPRRKLRRSHIRKENTSSRGAHSDYSHIPRRRRTSWTRGALIRPNPMAPNDAGGVAKEAPGPRTERARRRPPMQRVYAFQFMLLGATAIIGAYAEPVSSLPRLFLALVIWLVGYLALFMGIMAREWRKTVKKKKKLKAHELFELDSS